MGSVKVGEKSQGQKDLIFRANFASCSFKLTYAFCPPESTDKSIFPVFLSPGHRWSGPPVADTAHGAGVHGAEAGSSHQTVPPDRASKSCFLCTICQLTALLCSFLSSSLFPVVFQHFSLFKGFSSPISFFFSENK